MQKEMGKWGFHKKIANISVMYEGSYAFPTQLF